MFLRVNNLSIRSLRSAMNKAFLTLCAALMPWLSYAEFPINCGAGACGQMTMPPAVTALPVPCQGGSCGGLAFDPGNAVTTELLGDNTLQIMQEVETAILNFESFNVGSQSKVNFIQPDASSVALNRIFDQNPSLIFGALTANGQIYLVNNNGIVFGEGAQVNVGGLVASTLDISDEVFNEFNIATAINQELPAFSGGTAEDARVLVEQGASLQTVDGGTIFIFAPHVINKGAIETPGGQTILGGAEDRVFLYAPDAESGIRGLLVELDTGGDVENFGHILAERGNITLIGQAVRQAGSVTATTSVAENGSIRLLARDNATTRRLGNRVVADANSAGTVSIESNSVTQVVPDANSDLAPDLLVQAPSRIEILGRTVTFASDSTTRAVGGDVDITATVSPNPFIDPFAGAGQDPLVQSDARIFVSEGAEIDVSGDTSTTVSASRNQVELQIQSNELADIPSQAGGVLQGETVQIDARVGIDVADDSNALASINRSVNERLSAGGTVDFVSDGDVIFGQGALVDIAGGQVNYTAGTIETSQLVLGNQVIDISDADPTIEYDAVSAVLNERFIPAYREGKDAGTFSIRSFDLVFEGDINANTVSGIFQTQLPDALNNPIGFQRPFDQRAMGGGLAIDLFASNARDVQINPIAANNFESSLLAVDDALAANHVTRVDPSIFDNSGLSDFTITTAGKFELINNTVIDFSETGSFSVAAGEILVDGMIRTPSGQVNLETGFTPFNTSDVDGSITLTQNAVIDVSGNFVNQFNNALNNLSFSQSAREINGGSVNIFAEGDIDIQRNSLIDASASAFIDLNQIIQQGQAGDISVRSRQVGIDTAFTLDGTLRAFAASEGGALRVEANGVEVTSQNVNHNENILVLDPEFFSQGGFSSFDIIANREGFTIDSSATISPVVTNLLFGPAGSGQDGLLLGSATANGLEGSLVQRPAFERNPVSLQFSSVQSAIQSEGRGVPDLVLEQGASINVDALGSVSLISDNSLIVNGVISAPAGSINLSIINPLYEGDDLGFLPDQALFLSDTAQLISRGIILQDETALSALVADQIVLDAGQINFNTERGYIVGRAGSVIDVRGVQGTFNLPADGFFRPAPIQYATNSGAINFESSTGILINSTLSGRAQSTSSANASVRYRLNNAIGIDLQNNPSANPLPDDARRIIFLGSTDVVTPTVPGEAISDQRLGQAIINVADIQNGGFDQVAFSVADSVSGTNAGQEFDRIELTDNINLSARQNIIFESALVDAADFTANFSTSYLALGQNSIAQQGDIPTNIQAGNGELFFNAALIDVIGDVTFAGVDQATLHSLGDVRLRGVFTAGTNLNTTSFPQGSINVDHDLNIIAEQIYPTTLSDITIRSESADGTVFIGKSGTTPGLVLSAGGRLNIDASNITNQGVVRAPSGEIILSAAEQLTYAEGSVTSTSLQGALVPFGRTELGDFVVTLDQGGTSRTFEFSEPPQGNILSNSSNIDFQDNAILDVSGGGDLIASEFVPGLNGTQNILDSVLFPNNFAIVPTLGSDFAPIDIVNSNNFSLAIGTQVVLESGVNGLPAGRYTLLPASYAVLPGAFLVRATSGLDNLPTRSFARPDGSTLVQGRLAIANTPIIDATTRGFDITPNSALIDFIQLDLTSANQFFTNQAIEAGQQVPNLPQDAGNIVFNATEEILLNGTILANAPNGRAGFIDISSTQIALVDSIADSVPAGFLAIEASNFDNFISESILIGGTRQRTALGTEVNVSTTDIIVNEGVSIAGNEILLAARDTVALGENSSVRTNTERNINSSNETLVFAGDGALLRVSSNDQVTLIRTNAQQNMGTLEISESAILNASNSITLDSSLASNLQGDIQLEQGSLNLSSTSVQLGDIAGNSNTGFIISSDLINAVDLASLVITSQSTIDLAEDFTLDVDEVVFDAPQLRGFADSENIANTITVDSFTLRNSSGNSVNQVAEGQGSLLVDAVSVRIEDGNLQALNGNIEGGNRIDGFAQVQLNASDSFTYSGDNIVRFSGDQLDISAPILTAISDGADLTIDARDAITQIISGDTIATAELIANADAIGAGLTINASDLLLDTAIINRSGVVAVETMGDITLLDNTRIDVSGVARDFIVETLLAPGGNVSLLSQSGSIDAFAGASVTISGDDLGGNAGRFRAITADGDFTYEGSLLANAADGFQSGSVDIVARSLADFSGFNQKLNEAGAFNQRFIRLTGSEAGDNNITLSSGDIVQAEEIRLVADSGSVQLLDGAVIDASGDDNRADGGSVLLAALSEVRLESGSFVDLSASEDRSGEGGRLTARVASDDGQINLLAGSTIDLSGDADGNDGELTAILQVDPNNMDASDAVNRLELDFTGAVGNQLLEVFSVTQTELLTNANVQDAYNQVSNYLTNNSTALLVDNPDLSLMASIEFVGQNLQTSGAIDLLPLRFNDAPGTLTLRAANNLVISNNISDGFVLDTVPNLFTGRLLDRLVDEDSFSINVVAGSDIASADSLATVLDGGDLILNDSARIRTGTGDIQAASGGDLQLGIDSVIFTAGRSEGISRFAGQLEGISETAFETLLQGAQFGENGGNIRLNVQRNFIAPTNEEITASGIDNQFVNQYLFRLGGTVLTGRVDPTLVGVAHDQFRQGIGALGGGGHIDVNVAGNANNISLSIPDIITNDGELITADVISFETVSNLPVIFNGGDLQLNIGGDLVNSEVYIESGNGLITATGDIGKSEIAGSGLVLGLGDARVDISAGGQVNVDAIANPTLLPQATAQRDIFGLGGTPISNFSTFTDNTAVTVTSLTGDININSGDNQMALALLDIDGLIVNDGFESLRLFPGTLALNALAGNVVFNDSLTLFPSSNGGLRVFAGESIFARDQAVGQNVVQIALSDVNPNFLPSLANPLNSNAVNLRRTIALIASNDSGLEANPIRINDSQNSAFVALSGDVNVNPFNADSDEIITLAFNEPADVIAGRNIDNLTVNVQHNRADNISTIRAGNDIGFPNERRLQDGSLASNAATFEVSGPGALDIIAGRNIDLGASNGFVSLGNSQNAFLPEGGADISIFVGTQLAQSFNDDITVDEILSVLDDFVTGDLGARLIASGITGPLAGERDAFQGEIVASVGRLRQRIVNRISSFSEQIEGMPLSQAAAFAVFDDASQAQRRGVISDVLFDILNTAGLEAANTISTGFEATLLSADNLDSIGGPAGLDRAIFDLGFGIIEELFPEDQLSPGNFSAVSSRVLTTEGGDITILAPSGDVDIGLPVSIEGLGPPGGTGVIVLGQGNINILARNDVNVNTSRVVTVNGGDIVIWSSLGNIDAGVGPATPLPVPPPQIQIDENGQLVTVFPPALSGSGIQAVSPDPATVPFGAISLQAPNGVVDAGEAGIIGGNVTIPGELNNAGNVDAGSTTGFSLGDAGPPVGLSLAAGATSGSVSSTNDNLGVNNDGSTGSESFAEKALRILEVDVLGFGSEKIQDDDTASTDGNVNNNERCNSEEKACVTTLSLL